MKRRVIFLITAIIMFALLLSGCNNTTPKRVVRWKTAEWQELVYDVSAIDETNSIAPKALGDQVAYSQTRFDVLKKRDEIQPSAISGTYTTRIKKTSSDASTNDFESILDIFITYNIDDLANEFEGKEAALTAFIVKLEDYTATHEGFAVITESTITVHTVVISRCTVNRDLSPFITASDEAPTSVRTVQGVYVGKSAQEINDYSVSCKYITENKKTYCEYTIENNIDHSEDANLTGRFKYASSDSAPAYDNNLFFLAPRLYEHTAVASGVSYNILEPLQKKGSVAFSLVAYNDNALKIGSVEVYKAAIYIGALGGTQFAMVVDTQQKLPIGATYRIHTYTPLMIQQDWLLFTLQEQLIPAEARVAPVE